MSINLLAQQIVPVASLKIQKIELPYPLDALEPYYNKEMVDKAREHGIICNVFYCDDEEEAHDLLTMGMDTLLTNEYNNISIAVKN